jgi:hypothetical protein
MAAPVAPVASQGFKGIPHDSIYLEMIDVLAVVVL